MLNYVQVYENNDLIPNEVYKFIAIMAMYKMSCIIKKVYMMYTMIGYASVLL